MDISALSDFDSDFNEIDWVNSLFKDVAKTEKENTVEEAVTKLQIYVQQANSSIEKTSHDIISSMPSIAHDIKTLTNQSKQLKGLLEFFEKDIAKSETAFSMANLERLDDLKTKLEGAKNFLEQNDSFLLNKKEIDDILESETKDVGLACEKLYALQKSYEAQMGLAGQNERELVLEEFKNRIEAQVTSDVVKALQKVHIENDLTESKKFVEMFTKLGRLSQMKNYFGTLQREHYASKWIELTESIENSENQRFLADFYEFLLANWSKQLKYYREVFSSDGVVETVQVFIELLNGLHPSRETSISSYLKRTNEKMEFLMEISLANKKFADAICEKITEAQVNVPSDKMSALSKAIFDFYNIFIVQYSSIEQSFLNVQLEDTKVLQSNSSDTIRSLDTLLLKIFEWVENAIDRQSKITQDCAIVSLIYILNTFFKSFLEKKKKAQLQLDASRSDHQDWNLLSICISFLQIIGTFKMKLDAVEDKIKKIMTAKSKQIKANENFCYKIVGQRDINDFEKISERIAANLESTVIFESLAAPIDLIVKDSHQMLLRLIFQPIETFFKKLEVNESDSAAADLPDYSFTPHEYITEIGQFLLTLPQNLEPLLLNPAKPLKLALEMSDPSYKDNIPSADILLSLIADETCALASEKILQVPSIGSNGARQLATDIEYLSSVLDELGLTISSQLKQISQLLKAKEEGYLSACTGIDPRLVTRVRQMRNINVTDAM